MAARQPTPEQLRRLRTLRMTAGLSLDLVAERTGLPVAHVEALEEARIDELPAGPYIGAYYRLVRGVVAPTDEEEDAPDADPRPEPRTPLWVVRSVGVASVAGLLALLVWQVGSGSLDGAVGVAADMVNLAGPSAPDQRVVLTARREAHFRVEVDGGAAFDGRLAPGVSRTFEAQDRIVIDVRGVEDARIEYNGQPIVPQGRQGVPRRLVFLDDSGVAP